MTNRKGEFEQIISRMRDYFPRQILEELHRKYGDSQLLYDPPISILYSATRNYAFMEDLFSKDVRRTTHHK